MTKFNYWKEIEKELPFYADELLEKTYKYYCERKNVLSINESKYLKAIEKEMKKREVK